MKYDIVLAGVGGQGVLSIAATLGVAAVARGLRIKQSEVHGMSQRGGSVQSHFRIADRVIHSDLIPLGSADLLIALEPMETLRYVPYLAEGGVIVADQNPVLNIAHYPPLEAIYAALRAFPRVYLIDAVGTAKALRAAQASNMVLLGAASLFVPLEAAALEAAIQAVFGRKGEKVVEMNIGAFRAGRELIAQPV